MNAAQFSHAPEKVNPQSAGQASVPPDPPPQSEARPDTPPAPPVPRCSFRRPIIWLLFSLLALLLSVANSCALIADQGIHFTSPVQSFPLLSFSYLRIGSKNIMLKICRSM